MVTTLADWIIDFLAKQDIDFIFSHPGGPVLPFYDSMRRSGKPTNVLVRHEGAGSFMAEAYAKVTGKAGVCMSSMGPGAANMTIGVGTAMSDSTPLIAITGQLVSTSIGRGYQQQTDHNALFRGITKQTVKLGQTRNGHEVFERIFKVAISGRPGPVHVDVPVDISGAELTGARTPKGVDVLRSDSASRRSIRQALGLLDKAETPVILAGGGVILADAAEELTQFAESLGIPVATSYNGRGSIPEDHPLSLGRLGEATPIYCRKIASAADVLFAIGYRFTDVSLDNWSISSSARIVQLDIDPTEIGRTIPVDVPLVGDAKATLATMVSEVNKSGTKGMKAYKEKIQKARATWRKAYSSIEGSNDVPIKPQRVMFELTKAIGKDTIVTSGAGRAKMWAASVLPIYKPRTWIHSGGYAAMGYELCAAFASKLAMPHSKVVSVGGDASFQMHCQEIATAVEYDAPFVAVVLNDLYLGSIRNAQLKRYGSTFGTEFEYDVDLAEVAKAFGGQGSRITKPNDLAASINDAFESSKPTILDVRVDGSEVPSFDY